MTEGSPVENKRSRGVYILWTVALVLLLTLGIFCWLVVVRTAPHLHAELDGDYRVIPWDTYPEFGKLKTVSSITMSLRKGRGNITIAYADGSSHVIRVRITETDTGPGFTYTFPGYPRGPQGPYPLRAKGGDLQMYYCRRWTTFAVRKRLWPARGR